MGCPILGDSKYGQGSYDWQNKESIGLAATAISFKSATDEKQINLEIPLPEEWKKYI
jgi:23S rRNA-/tRNA-specific pseudouridylate synthase